MARPKKINNTHMLICATCKKEFELPKYKTRKYCSKSCVQQDKTIREEYLIKRNKTNIERYGVESPLQSSVILEKYKSNLIQKYGVNNPFLVKKFKDKSDATLMQKYGVKVASQNSLISKKISIKLKDKKYDRVSFSEIKWEKVELFCKETNMTALFDKEFLLQNKISDPLLKAWFLCNKCLTKTEVCLRNGYFPSCSKCSKYKGYSLIEEEIFVFIQENYEGEILLKKRNILSSSLELDIFLPSLNLAIEINGLYWHSEIWGKYKNYHLNKTEQCLAKDITLLHIWDHEWIFKKDIIKSMILNKLNKTSTKIYARKCIVKEISFVDKHKFVNETHLKGDTISKINLGLYYNDELVSVMTFGKFRFSKDNSIELIRFCSKLNTIIIGGASKIFSYFTKNYNPDKIITYADRRYSLGKTYSNLGFIFTNFTPPNYFYWKNMKIFNRINFQKHKLSAKLEKFDKQKTEYENMKNNGFNKVWDCGHYKFIWEKAQLL